jgi:hypothetical protein
LDPVSLELSAEVLTRRKEIEELVLSLQRQVNVGLMQLNKMQSDHKILAQHGAAMIANKDFKIERTIPKPEEVPLENGTFTTTCLTPCYNTCHESCNIKYDALKYLCSVMNMQGNCRVCKNKCPSSTL